ncbi:MAG: DUF896 domain-containing protein [Firmicutes bacterium]|nr:DUF896 domain-containing protein [Bacillota bacterium]
MQQNEIERINQLARKQKTVGLSDEEKKEQAELRKRFLEDFRANFKAQLDNIEVVDGDDPRLAKNQNKRPN